MRLGAITDEFSPDLDIAAPAIREVGLEGAELRVLWGRNVLDVSDADLDRAVALLKTNNLTVNAIASPLLKCVLPGGPDLDTRFQQDVFASKHTFEDQQRLTTRAFEVAKRCGARIVRVFSYWRVMTPDHVFDRIVQSLGNLADQAAVHGIVIALENEHACNVATARETARILAALDHPNLQVVWDPANCLVAGETPFSSGYRQIPVSRIAHVHAKDCTFDGNTFTWVAFGEGQVVWRGQIAALIQDGYKGDINLETHWSGPDNNKLEASRICARNLRALVASL